MPRRLILTRDLPAADYDWLDRDLYAGEIMWEFTGCTWGVIDHEAGLAASERPGQGPFYEIPYDAIKEG